jgi:hypothetical protein
MGQARVGIERIRLPKVTTVGGGASNCTPEEGWEMEWLKPVTPIKQSHS